MTGPLPVARYGGGGEITRFKRGGKDERLPLDEAMEVTSRGRDSVDLLALDQALTRLAAMDERQSRIVEAIA